MTDIILVEGDNELNVALQPVPPSAGIVSLDWYQTQPFPPNQRQRLTIRMQNLVAYPYPYTLEVYDNDNLVGFTPTTIDFNANQAREHTVSFTVGGVGTHQVTAKLYYGDTLLDTATAQYTVAEVDAVIDGIIRNWLIWHEPMAKWEITVSGVEIPQGEEIYLAPEWINRSEISVTGHIDLSIRYPDGTTRSLSTFQNQDRSASPGDGWMVVFNPFISSQVGIYTATATLSIDGRVVDTVSIQLVVG